MQNLLAVEQRQLPQVTSIQPDNVERVVNDLASPFHQIVKSRYAGAIKRERFHRPSYEIFWSSLGNELFRIFSLGADPYQPLLGT